MATDITARTRGCSGSSPGATDTGQTGLDESVQEEPTRWAENFVYVGGPTFDAAFADGREVSA